MKSKKKTRTTRRKRIKYKVDPDVRQEFVTKINTLRKRGKTIDVIADELNSLGFLNRDGNPINRNFVMNMLHRHC